MFQNLAGGGGFDPTIYKDRNLVNYNAVGSSSITILSVTGKKGYIDVMKLYSRSTGGTAKIKITVDGVVIFYANRTSDLTAFIHDFLSGMSDSTPNMHSMGINSTALSDGGQLAANITTDLLTSQSTHAFNKLFWNDSIEILAEKTVVSGNTTCELQYYLEE